MASGRNGIRRVMGEGDVRLVLASAFFEDGGTFSARTRGHMGKI
jgi:hypothetical protein